MAQPPFRGAPPWGGQAPPPYTSNPPVANTIPGTPLSPYVGNVEMFGGLNAASPITFRAQCQKGNGIVIFFINNGNANSVRATDTAGNLYNASIGSIAQNGSTQLVSAVWTPYSFGTNPVVSVSWTGGTANTICGYLEIVGANAGWFVDMVTKANTTAATIQPYVRSTGPNDIFATCVGYPNQVIPTLTPSGFTVRTLGLGGSNPLLAMGWSTPSYISQTPTGTVGPTWNGITAAGAGSITFAIRSLQSSPEGVQGPPANYKPTPPWINCPVPAPRVDFFPAPSADVTAALGGQRATFTAGTVIVDFSVPLVGQSAAFTAGLLTPNSTIALVGQQAAFAAGTLGVNFDIPLVGQQAVFTAGNVAVSGDVTLALVGQQAVFTAGTLVANPQIALVGQSGTFSPGLLAPSMTVALTGQPATYQTGNLIATPQIGLAGSQGLFSSGLLSPSSSVGLLGQQAVFIDGTIGVGGDKQVDLTGASSLFFPGNVRAVLPDTGGGGRPPGYIKDDEDRATRQVFVLRAWQDGLISSSRKEQLMRGLKKKP